MKKSFWIILSLCALQYCYGQSQENAGTLQELKKLPVPPSPNASAIGKFGEIPVSMSTGIPNISIPFFSYADQQKSLSLNVSLSYHAGGHKVEDMPSNVGLGWSLSAGGVVSRSMRGIPDDATGGYISTAVLPYIVPTSSFDPLSTESNSSTSINDGVCYYNSTDFSTVRSVGEGSLDGECDMFQFSVGGISGKFFFKKDGTPQLTSQSNVKITYNRLGGTGGITDFTITDGQGIKYFFNQPEGTQAISYVETPPPGSPGYTSSWYLSKITSADGQDEILFTYNTPGNIYYEGSFSDSYRSTYFMGSFSGTEYTQSFNYLHTMNPKRVSTISFPDGTQLEFFYNLARQDYVGDNALTEVRITNDGRQKKFLLAYDYFISPTCSPGTPNCTSPIAFSSHDYYKRLKLVSVTENDGTTSLPPYTFEYDPTPLPVRNSKAQDAWGYYNGLGSNAVLTSTNQELDGGGQVVSNQNRLPDANYTRAWVLEKIFYPTGGNTRFVYEGNDGYYDGVYTAIGGIRVKRTEDFDGVTGKITVANYSYKKADNTSSGTLKTKPNNTAYWTRYHMFDGSITTHNTYLNQRSDPTQSLSYFQGSPVVYSRVKMDKDIDGKSNGYSIHEFEAFSSAAIDDQYPFMQVQEMDWGLGVPLKEYYYNAGNVLIRSVENQYQYYNSNPSFSDGSVRNMLTGMLHWDNNSTFNQYIFGVECYFMIFGRADLVKTTEKLYDPNGNINEVVTEHTYDATYFVPTMTKTKSSKGEATESRFYYPFNYNVAGLAKKTELMDANRVAEKISAETWEDNGSGTFYLKGGKVSDYAAYGSMIKENKVIAVETTAPIAPGTVGAFDPNNLKRHSSFKDQVLITGYEPRGRYSGMSYPGELNYAFIWGRSNNYPVATVKNAAPSNIAYTSFELDGNGNWQGVNAGNIVSSAGITGDKYYQQASFSLTANGLTSSMVYLVTYWSKNSSYSVNGTQVGWPKILSTVTINAQTWTCYEHLISGQTSISVTGSGSIDELRLYPRYAEMTTVSYNPLTGITSQCDATNRITYYEYDGFFRLSLVRDQFANVLKKICYQYNGQIENCSGITNNPVWQRNGNKRCKPCELNAAYYSGREEAQEINTNPSSAGYNTTRWVDIGNSTACEPQQDWQTMSSSCEVVGGQNTGNKILVQKDLNPCSPTYNQTRNVSVVDHFACPPPGCNMANCNGVDKKCVNGVCETGVKVYISSVFNEELHQYECTYHYEFSDGTWSSNYVEYSGAECPLF
ncbi:MAG: hypothetical protein ACTHMV_09485 [Chitinophagaceae bacterium]